MQNSHSIVLVEDHVIVRNGLKELIEHIGNYKVTAEFNNGKELTDNIETVNAAVVVMDFMMPEMNGAETMVWLKSREIDLPVLILTLDTSDKTIIELFKLGVRGYLLKTCTAATLKSALDSIIQTGYYHNDLLNNAIISNGAASPRYDMPNGIKNKFNDRELHFLELVCDTEEYTYEQIANIMNVHRRTVDGYRESLFEKLDIKSKSGLVLFAIKHRLVKI